MMVAIEGWKLARFGVVLHGNVVFVGQASIYAVGGRKWMLVIIDIEEKDCVNH